MKKILLLGLLTLTLNLTAQDINVDKLILKDDLVYKKKSILVFTEDSTLLSRSY